MTLDEAIEIICNDYCKYPDIESGNKLADICDKCPMNKCEDLRWADRKTENSSEKPNNCDTCRNKGVEGCEQPCLECGCCGLYEPKDEPQTDLLVKTPRKSRESHEKAKDEPQTELVNDSPILAKDLVDDEFNPYDEECMRCKHLKLQCEFVPSYCKYEPRDEPQTDEFKQFDREDLILLIECQKERIAELLAKDEPQTEREGE